MVFDRAIQRAEAARRTKYITDMSLIISGVLSKGGHKDVAKQLDSLGAIMKEEKSHGNKPNQS